MARRKRKSGIENLIESPWWLNLVLAIVAFVFLRWLVPSIMSTNPFLKALALTSYSLAPWAGLFLLLITGISYIRGRTSTSGGHPKIVQPSVNRHQPPSNISVEQDLYPFFKGASGIPKSTANPTEWSLELLRELEWKRFEVVCAAYFQELGLRTETLRCGPDGGIDAKLFRSNASEPESIIQCKAWNARYVGVKPVRELFGVMAHEKVAKGIFLTTSNFTREAQEFSQEKSLFLINGEMFLEMLGKLPEVASKRMLTLATEGDYMTPTCPSCGIKMVTRNGGGKSFWGCVNFPRCRQTFVMKSA